MKGGIDHLTWKHDPVIPEGEKFSRKRMDDEEGVRRQVLVPWFEWHAKGSKEHFAIVLGFGMLA
jgi:hypothetical protein